jgi:hypothetical protein
MILADVQQMEWPHPYELFGELFTVFWFVVMACMIGVVAFVRAGTRRDDGE